MIFAKTITYGLDTQVKRMQEYMDVNLGWTNVNIYGLIQKTTKNNKIVPEAYISEKDYKEVFLNDKVYGSVGFIETNREIFPVKKSTIDVVFTVLLSKIYPSSTTRENELCMLQAERCLEYSGLIYNVTGLKQGIDDVFSGFNTDNIKHLDMHPWMVFSFEIELQYTDDSC